MPQVGIALDRARAEAAAALVHGSDPATSAATGTGRLPVGGAVEPRRRLGLRARSAVAAGAAALVGAVTLSAVAYLYVRSYLISQRDRVTLTQTFANASVVRDNMLETDPNLNQLLRGLRSEPGGSVLLHYKDTWYSPGVGVSADALPASVTTAVDEGLTGRQRIVIRGASYQAVAVALPEVNASYLELFPLTTLERTLQRLRAALVLGSAMATVGGILLGAWSSRRVLRPLRRVSQAASQLSAGTLDTRLPAESDADLARLVVAFNSMADVVQRRIEQEARFAADVSHELRTPLAAVRNSAEVLERRRDELSDRARQALDLLLRKVDRFDRVTQDLLELSRMDAGADRDSNDEVMLDDVLLRIARGRGADDLLLECDASIRNRPVLLDRRRLERIIGNLLDNAKVHAGGAVTMTAAGVDQHLIITVEDAGPGVPASERDLIFDRFHRGGGASERPGSGLGLALVAEHAARMGGSVSVEDRRGGGARFVLRLPWRRA